jgi:hypothetical protein
MQIAIEEQLLLCELDDYFQALRKGVSSESLDNVLPEFGDVKAGHLADMDKQRMQADSFYGSRG